MDFDYSWFLHYDTDTENEIFGVIGILNVIQNNRIDLGNNKGKLRY